jgi:hypothetical protein
LLNLIIFQRIVLDHRELIEFLPLNKLIYHSSGMVVDEPMKAARVSGHLLNDVPHTSDGFFITTRLMVELEHVVPTVSYHQPIDYLNE